MNFSARAVFRIPNGPMLTVFLLAGCVFNTSGLPHPAPDGASGGQDMAVDTDGQGLSDGRADYALDSGADQQMDPECAKSHGSNVCHEQAAFPGQSGICVGGKFVLDRYCFSGAPCNPETGLCSPVDYSDCGLQCDGVCTAFLVINGNPKLYCVGTSLNGSGTALTSCTREQQHLCKTGLCTSDNNCFEDCSIDPGTCPKEPKKTQCVFVTVTIGQVETYAWGCQIKN